MTPRQELIKRLAIGLYQGNICFDDIDTCVLLKQAQTDWERNYLDWDNISMASLRQIRYQVIRQMEMGYCVRERSHDYMNIEELAKG